MNWKRATVLAMCLALVLGCLWLATHLFGEKVEPAWGEAVEGVRLQAPIDNKRFLEDAANRLRRAVGGRWHVSERERAPGLGIVLSMSSSSSSFSATGAYVPYYVLPFPLDEGGAAKLRQFREHCNAALRLLGSNERCTVLAGYSNRLDVSRKIARVLQVSAVPEPVAGYVSAWNAIRFSGQVTDRETGDVIGQYVLQYGHPDPDDPSQINWRWATPHHAKDGTFDTDSHVGEGKRAWLRVVADGYLPQPVTAEPLVAPANAVGLSVRLKRAAVEKSAPVKSDEATRSTRQTAEPPWGEAVQGVQVRLRADKTVWMSDTAPTFQLDLRNNGKAQYSFRSTPEGSCEVELDGSWYTASARAERTVSVWLVQPGEEVTEALEIALGESWVAEGTGKSPEIGLGTHTVRVRFRPLSPRIHVISNPVEITIERALPGSRLSIEEAAGDLDFAFAAVCEAASDVQERMSEAGVFGCFQDFKVVQTLAGTPPDGQALSLRFVRFDTPGMRERPITKGEKVIWFVSRPREDAPDQWPGVKALPDTPENRKAVVEAVERDAYWGPVTNGLQCRFLPMEQTVEVAEGARPKDIEVYVTYEHRNVGKKLLTFLPWHSPWEQPPGGDIFEVLGPEGDKARYLGRYVERGLPEERHFVYVPRGKMLSKKVRVPYDFSKPGLYRISFSTSLSGDRAAAVLRAYYEADPSATEEFVEDDILENANNVWTGTLTSNTVTVKIVRPGQANLPAALDEPVRLAYVDEVIRSGKDVLPRLERLVLERRLDDGALHSALSAIARIHFEEGRYQECLDQCHVFLTRFSPQGYTHTLEKYLLIGDCHRKLGDTKTARSVYLRALYHFNDYDYAYSDIRSQLASRLDSQIARIKWDGKDYDIPVLGTARDQLEFAAEGMRLVRGEVDLEAVYIDEPCPRVDGLPTPEAYNVGVVAAAYRGVMELHPESDQEAREAQRGFQDAASRQRALVLALDAIIQDGKADRWARYNAVHWLGAIGGDMVVGPLRRAKPLQFQFSDHDVVDSVMRRFGIGDEAGSDDRPQ